MSFQAMAWAIQQRTGDPLAKLLLLALANYADEHNESWPSLSRLADDLELSRRSITNKLEVLEQNNLVMRRSVTTRTGAFDHTVYTLCVGEADRQLPPPPEPAAAPAPVKAITVRQPRAIPMDWEPTPELLSWAKLAFPNLDVTNEVPRFRDYWLGNGKPHADWDATFRNWCRRSVKFDQPRVYQHPSATRSTDNDRKLNEYLDLRGHHEQGQRAGRGRT
jgi:hypothetical protein